MPKGHRVRFAWLHIKDDILAQISEHKYRPGDRISTVTQLAERHGVSTTTVRQALDELSMEGVLEVRQGRGTIVAPPKREYDPTKGFEEQVNRLGGAPRTHIYQTQWSTQQTGGARLLKLRKGEKHWEVTRLHYIDEEPIMIDVAWFPRAVAERFMGDSRLLMTLFSSLPKHLGYQRWHVSVTSVRFTTERAFSDVLGIPRKTPFFHIDRLITVKNKLLFSSSVVLRSDKFQLTFP